MVTYLLRASIYPRCFYTYFVSAGPLYNLLLAFARMGVHWNIVYLLTHKTPPPESLKKFDQTFLASVCIEGVVTIIYTLVVVLFWVADLHDFLSHPLYYFYLAKTTFWCLMTFLMFPIGMCVLKNKRAALEGYEEL